MAEDAIAKPFLRWAGGKKWFLKHLSSLLPANGFNNYHEPFLGGASVFFQLKPANRSFLSDANHELIETYRAVKDYPNDIIKHIKRFKNTKEHYYRLRSKKTTDPLEKAAIFIFLNMTSYNGIYRVNRDGHYNVPFGYRYNVMLNEDNILNASTALQKSTLYTGDFESCKENIKKGDLIFLDPPYTVSHNNNGFIEYNKKLFSLEDQYRLHSLIDFIKVKKAYYILTNAGHAKIEEIFSGQSNMLKMDRKSLIGGKNAKREEITEFVFTNVI